MVPDHVVTGSTDGIGKAYAMELAQYGVNIVLISRSSERLKKVASEIESLYNVQTKVVKADFSQGAEIYPDIAAHLDGIEVGILVNNVGAMDYPQYFLEMAAERVWQLIYINIGAATLELYKLTISEKAITDDNSSPLLASTSIAETLDKVTAAVPTAGTTPPGRLA
ncbi:inactive hydroxysteroid dehydrogenase-like protein 1 [Diadema antillarum]|uniref:inactive hydroxysteroid dehydrogenase-like protein 1 n=1 Tax=Diadema antillarum TaxID=105358 RepID=UPI003A8B411F